MPNEPAHTQGAHEAAAPMPVSSMQWRPVCALDDIVAGTGAAALIDGVQVAIVRMPDGATVYAVGHFDPFSKAYVMARGIVGDRAGVPKLASPIYKQNFDLRTGACLDDPCVTLPSWATRVREGTIEILWPDNGIHKGIIV